MATYKVPQDVEAEDKLLGPFTFRQFIYLLISAAGIAIIFGLFQIFPLLAIIPIPFTFFFLILALPIKKDQPMEVYLASIASFYLKPNAGLLGKRKLPSKSLPLKSSRNLAPETLPKKKLPLASLFFPISLTLRAMQFAAIVISMKISSQRTTTLLIFSTRTVIKTSIKWSLKNNKIVMPP